MHSRASIRLPALLAKEEMDRQILRPLQQQFKPLPMSRHYKLKVQMYK
jgi:hypothetical protein